MRSGSGQSQVLIAGGGPVGLSLAIELGLRGVDCLLVEPRARARVVPRAKLLNVRSMEHMRRWGIAEEVRRVTPLPASYSTEIAFVTRLLDGHEITRFANVFNTAPVADPRFAEPAQQIPQYVLEPLLRRRARSTGHVRFAPAGTRVLDVTQREDEVEVKLGDGAEASRTVSARFVVGCDGAASTVRQQLGIEMEGRRAIARNYSVVFRSRELHRRLSFAPALHFWTVNTHTPSYMGPLDSIDLWWLQATRIGADIDPATIVPQDVVHGAVGAELPDLEILGTDPWEVQELTAHRLRRGSVFLAGDAAHLHSPMGAHGMNQGIGDAVDLGWKLAAALDGWGGRGLLDSYAAERQPFHRRAIDEASRNNATLANELVRPGLEDPGALGEQLRAQLATEIQLRKHREFNSLGLVLGHCYEGSPIVVADETPVAPEQVEHFEPRARPGRRLPHAWLRDGSSLFDHLAGGFTLLHVEGADPEPLMRAAAERALPLRLLAAPRTQPAATLARLALVRPDQVLAWHGDSAPPDSLRVIDTVTGRG